MKIIIYCLCFVFSAHIAFSQELSKKEIKEIEITAEDFLFRRMYRQALPYMTQLEKIDPARYKDYRLLIAKTYVEQTSHIKNARPYLEKIVAEEKKIDAETYFYLGRVYQHEYEFDKAIEAYRNFVRQAKKSDERVPRAERRIEQCKNAKLLVEEKEDFKIENLGGVINTTYPEYVPVISADEAVLLFTSRRPGSTGGLQDISGNTDTVAGEFFEDIYVSININEDWKEPTTVGSNINTNGHDASIGLSPDGQKLFIYRSDSIKYGNIFVCHLEGYEWGAPQKLPEPINLKDSWEGSVSISGDENTLFFASTREGGYGGKDIYMIRKLPDGSWAQPMNLGSKINTPYDDDAPFIHPDGKTLYFSSQGHNSMGGYDIFKTELEEERSWTTPENIGYPINTPDDDIYFVISASGERGYYSSFKNDGIGEKDIYVVHMPKEEKSAPKPLTMLKGTIQAGNPPEAIDANIIVTDNETGEIVGVYKPNSATGNYLIIVPSGKNYNIAIEADDYLFHSENVYVPDQKEFVEVKKDIILTSADIGSKIVLNNIFFDFDKATLRPQSRTELERLYKLMEENPELKVELGGHTDSRGDDNYNLQLSQKRAEAVVNYLVNKGISNNRLMAKGYGETQPVAPNENTDGSDNPEGRQMNRRTELKILDN